MEPILILGLTAGALTTFSLLPQVIKTIKIKETRDISLWMYILISTGILAWLTYGLLIKDVPVIAANTISIIFASIMLFSKIRYG